VRGRIPAQYIMCDLKGVSLGNFYTCCNGNSSQDWLPWVD
jgi:hypothetical protein